LALTRIYGPYKYYLLTDGTAAGAGAGAGVVDEATMRQMKMPRCGVTDVTVSTVTRRRKRYTLAGIYGAATIQQ